MLALRAAAVAAVAVISFSTAFMAPALARDTWRISLQYPGSDMMVAHIRNFAEKVRERTGGAIKSEVFTDYTLFKQGQELPAMQRGNLDIAVLNTGDIEQQIAEYSIFSSGYLFRDHNHFRAVFDGPIGKEFGDKIMDKLDVKVLGVLYGGTRQMNLRAVREVKVPADLAGVKLRMPGAPAWQTLGKGLGVTPTPMAVGEIYLGLRTGAIDGQENPLTLIRSFKLEEVSKQLVLTGHMVQAVVLTMAGPTWKALTPEQQTIVIRAAEETVQEQDKARFTQEIADLEYFRARGLVVTQPDVEAFRKSVQAAFEASGLAATWPAELIGRIAAVK
jgi:tripartite ATP-independent transporter DctP family solute receptor